MPISTRHALTEREFKFCKVYAGFGYSNGPEAYRRSHCVENPIDLKWYFPDKDGGPDLAQLVDGKLAYTRAKALLESPHISGFLEELKLAAGDHARTALGDAVLFGDEASSLKAAGQVLADEDKLGFRDAVERWIEVVCAVGGEVVIPLPGGGEVTADARQMFPKYAEAMPPAWVIEKTIRTLQQYHAVQVEKERDGSPA